MPGPGLFLFDVDGTLVRLEGAGRRALTSALGEVFDVPDPEAVMAPIRFDGNTDRAIVREAVRRAGLGLERFEALRGPFEEAYVRALRGLLAGAPPRMILPGVVDLLERLLARGDVAGLLTGNSEAGARTKLEPFGLNRYFPAGGFGSDHEDRVALVPIARRRLEEHTGLRFVPELSYMIGDSVMDIRAGRAARFRTVAVLTGWTPASELEAERPDYLLPDLTGLPGLV